MTNYRPASGASSLTYSYYVVSMLMLAYTLSFMDRVLISLLIEPIRAEFDLSDTQIGALIGFGFVLFYSMLGIPFGSLADRTNRRNLIVVGILGWSLATAGSGIVQGFGGLLLMRVLVGVGEATLSPCALSTVGDRFPRDRLAFAVALYSSGVVIGGGLAMVLGGGLAEWAMATRLDMPLLGTLTGWRLTFLLVGIAGLPIAALILLTVREAPRLNADHAAPMSAVLALMNQHRTAFVGSFFGLSFIVLANFVQMLWAPAFLVRTHGMSLGNVGLVLGMLSGVVGFLGVLAGGAIADRIGRRGILDAPIRVILVSQAIQLPFMVAAFTLANRDAALICIGLAMFFASILGGLQGTTVSLLVPANMRGRAFAIYLLIANLIGMGLGPLIVGLLSDRVTHSMGPAIAIAGAFGLVAGLAIIAATRPAIREAIAANLQRG